MIECRKTMKYLNQAVLLAFDTYRTSAQKSPRIVIDLLALAQLCRKGEHWRTAKVTESQLDRARAFLPDLSTKTNTLLTPGFGTVFILPRPFSIGAGQEIEHVAVAHARAGVPITGTTPQIVFRQDLFIYGAASKAGCLCGFVNMADQPTIGSIKLLPGFSWNDLAADWRTQLETDEIRPDTMLFALAISLSRVCRTSVTDDQAQ